MDFEFVTRPSQVKPAQDSAGNNNLKEKYYFDNIEDDSENDVTDRIAPMETDRPLAMLLPFAKSTSQLYIAVTLCVTPISDLLNIVTIGDELSFIGGQSQMFISMYIKLKYD